jgi:hypothetical protein
MTMLRPHRHPRKCQTSKSPMTFVTYADYEGIRALFWKAQRPYVSAIF